MQNIRSHWFFFNGSDEFAIRIFFSVRIKLGLVGVWLAITVDEWTRAIIMYFRWKSRKWERYALVSPKNTRERIHIVKQENLEQLNNK